MLPLHMTGSDPSMPEIVRQLMAQFLEIWWACDTSLPDLGPTYTPKQQLEEEKRLGSKLDAIYNLLKRPPRNQDDARRAQELIYAAAVELGSVMFGLEAGHFQAIQDYGLLDVAEEFAQMARTFDPSISDEDIFQASRNVWSMNFMQILYGLPVQVTPSIFAYSMLYPYTDNYLDDPAISLETKLAFNSRFRQRLAGEQVTPANTYEEIISNLIGMIEGQFDRDRFPQVFDSLLAIHAAQGKSLGLLKPDASPYEIDVLGICFEKGGTSVLADGYLMDGSLTPAQREFTFYYGTFTQLVDDLEDVQKDLRDGLQTVFSQTARHWPLDKVTNRTFHFGEKVIGAVDAIQSPSASPLKEMLKRSVRPLLLVEAGSVGRFYTRPYLRELEAHSPVRFSFLAGQRKRFMRRQGLLMGLVETLAAQSRKVSRAAPTDSLFEPGRRIPLRSDLT